MSHPPRPRDQYVFGGSVAEAARLLQLDELLQPGTQQVLRQAGITGGMRVLDVGCGPGSVTFLAAELVGPAGSVVGIDRDPTMLAAAQARAQARAQTNVSFIQADLDEPGHAERLDPGFDALAGRLILLHLADPAAALRRLISHLRPGGVVMFQEPDLTRMGASFPPLPALEQLCARVKQAHRRLGIDIQFGLRLPQLFEDAGLPPPHLRCDAFIGTGPSWAWYEQMLSAARNALPVALSRGTTTSDQADIQTLEAQLRQALACQRSVTRAIDLISAWTRTASTPLTWHMSGQ